MNNEKSLTNTHINWDIGEYVKPLANSYKQRICSKKVFTHLKYSFDIGE